MTIAAWLDSGYHFDLVLLPVLVVAFGLFCWFTK